LSVVFSEFSFDSETLKLGFRRSIRFLKIDVPIAQIFQSDGSTRYGTTDEGAGADNTYISIEIDNLSFSDGNGAAFITVHVKSDFMCEKRKRI